MSLSKLLQFGRRGPAYGNGPFSVHGRGRPGSPPSSVLPTGGGQALLDPADTVFLLLDHQSGLLQTVKDVDISDLRRNTTRSAKLAALFKIPVITTASEPNGPNGPLIPEIHEVGPMPIYVPRKGEVNAWDNPGLRRTPCARPAGRRWSWRVSGPACA